MIQPAEIIPVDESMSAFRPQTTKTGGLPNISYIMRKPEDLGTEFKTSVCPVTGVMTYMEIQQGKELMKGTTYFSELGATASCLLRVAEGVTHKRGTQPEEIVLGDSWFGSVKAAVAQSQAGFECVLQVKQNFALFPKKVIENVLKDAPGGVHIVLRGEHPTGVNLLAVGYKYNKKSVLHFVCTEHAGTTEDGDPYEMKWTDDVGNVHIRNVARPAVISKFFQNCNSVDVHNHLRQSCLKLEKQWVTTDCWFRLFTTLVGINVVDTFRLAKFHNMIPRNKLNLAPDGDVVDDGDQNIFTMKKFAGILSNQLLLLADKYAILSEVLSETDDDDDMLYTGVDKRNRNKKAAKRNKSDDDNCQGRSGGGLGVAKRQKKDEKKENKSKSKKTKKKGYKFIRDKVKSEEGYCVGGTGFTYPIEISSTDDNSTLLSHDTYEEFDFDVPEKKKKAQNVIQQMRDVCGLPHSVVKLTCTVSNGASTKGKKYSKPRRCHLCGAASRVKCRECNKVFCYPLRNKTEVKNCCFYNHVKGVTRKTKRASV